MNRIDTIKYRLMVLLAACAVCMACEEDAEPMESVEPEAELSETQTDLTIAVNEPFSLSANVTTEGRVTSKWYVDGVLEAATTVFDYKFTAPGIYVVKYEARTGAGEFIRTWRVTVTDVLEMELSVGDSTVVERIQLDDMMVMAVVISGENVRHLWKVDDVVVSDEALLKFNLAELKDYMFSYVGENEVGRFEKTFTVHVLERPLEIAFSEEDAGLSLKENQTLEITADVLYGGSGVTHEWKVNDEVVSTSATLNHAFAEEGVYTVAYKAVNSKGESVEKSWTVTVVAVDITLMHNFEAETSIPAIYSTVNTPGLALVDNPLKDDVNNSNKVLRQQAGGTASTSGFMDVDVSGFDMTQYTGFRFKLYRGQNAYFPYIEVDGTKVDPVTPASGVDAWETLEFRFEANAWSKITIRLMKTASGGNITGGNIDGSVPDNTRTVYLDDFELLP